jgi:two-component system, NarL family, nitrate/nitrite response regulator NarL
VPGVRAAVVSEDPLARSGLAALLAARDDVSVVGGVAPGDLDGLRPLAAEALLYDCSAQDPASARALADALPTVALAATVSQGAEALAAGARAVLFRDAPPDRVAAALRAASAGLVALDEGLAAWIRPPPELSRGEVEGLTPREAEVLGLLAEGLSNKGIAQRLGVSERTAKFHVESILGKLGAESRSEAIVLAARRGLVTL